MEPNRIVKAKVREFEISDPQQPFKDDKLGRKEYAEVLTGVVEAFGDGAVIALNGAWGTGKTTFLKMWKQHLINAGFPVIYYNAWEDDICEEPLLSLLRNLNMISKEQDGGKLEEVFKVGGRILAGIAIGAAKGALGKVGEILAEAGKGGLDAIHEQFAESLKEKDETSQTMQEFKKVLKEYVAFVCDDGKPLIYFIDELDRCNPTFAVKVLERIKHLFDVPNVVFVLSVDKKQLACSVKGFYGSHEIDAEEYLRRFIDIEYYLPEPDAGLFCEYLFDYYNFNSFFKNEYRLGEDFFGKNSDKAATDKDDLLYMAKAIAKYKHLSLRQIERIFAIARIGLCSMPVKSEILPQLFFFLSYLKTCESDMYNRISDFSYDLQGFVNAIECVITSEMLVADTTGETNFHYLMAMALLSYYEGYKAFIRKKQRKIVELYYNNNINDGLKVNFSIIDGSVIPRYLQSLIYNDLKCDISHIIEKLNLLEQLNPLFFAPINNNHDNSVKESIKPSLRV